MICLGLDVGSTSIKGAIFDLEHGDVQSVMQVPFPAPLSGLPTGHFEIAPVAIVAAVEALVTGLLREAPAAEAIFCSGQMGGVILVDDAGTALTNYLSWRDQRTLAPHRSADSYLDAIRARWSGGELAELGNELQAGSAAGLLFWLTEQNQLPKAMPATVADYVLGRLCRVSPRMDPTQAIGLLDLRAGTWHRDALDALGLAKIRWPQLAESRTPIGFLSFNGRRIACYAALGDQQCALKGAGLKRNELSINISTGSQVSRRTATFEPGPYQSRPYFDGDFLNTITHLPAGRSLNVLCDLLTELTRAQGVAPANPWAYIAQCAADTDGGGLDVDLAFFAGPLGSSGHLQGITIENLTIGNLFHAAFRSMADNYARCADRLFPQRAGISIALSGGLTRSVPILRKLIEERLRMPLRETAAVEETLLGLLEHAREVCLIDSRRNSVEDVDPYRGESKHDA